MADSFSTQIDRFVIDTEEKLLAVLRLAIDETVNEAQTIRPDGGKLPFKDGFLWHSGSASLNSIPSGPTKGEKGQKYAWSDQALVTTLADMEIGDIFVFGWTAVYARVQELRYGYLESAMQNWQKHVDSAVAKVKDT